MPKKILLIESDGAFAQEMSAAIEARGLAARVTADGKEGLDLARVERPDLIVLCVELPRMSGYSVCNKLKKDDELRSIPLVIISAEATPETFDQHRKLKTHADDYLIKPFAAADLLQKIARLVDLPTQAADDELVTLDDVEELEALGASPVDAAPAESGPSAQAAEDDDLKLLDDAFNSLASEDATGMTAIVGAPSAAAPARSPVVAAAAAPDPGLEIALEVEPASPAVAPPPDVDRLGDEADAALAALGADDVAEIELPDPATFLDDDGPTASGEDLLRRAGIEVEPPPPPPAPAGVGPVLRADILPPSFEPAAPAEADAELRRELETVRAALEEQQASAAAATAARQVAEEEARAARADAEESAARAGREEAARRALEESLKDAEARAAEAERRAAEAEESNRAAAARAEAAEVEAADLRREADGARRDADAARRDAEVAEREVEAARRDADAARRDSERVSGEAAQARGHAEELARDLQQAQERASEHESALAALRPELEALGNELAEAHASAAVGRADLERTLSEREKRLAELEAQNAKHEERVVKAYQKIKGDEKIREKARKALAIALQLLEERSTAAATPGEIQPRRE